MRTNHAIALALLLAAPALGCPTAPSDTDPGTSTTMDSGSTDAVVESTTSVQTGTPDSTSSADSSSSSAGSTASPSDDSTSSSGSDPTTGGPLPGGYDPCANPDMPCLVEGEACLAFSDSLGICAAHGCGDSADCPANELGGDAQVACLDVAGSGVLDCVLDCDGATCPNGAVCIALQTGPDICMWPVPPAGGGMCPDQDLGNTVPQSAMGDNSGLHDDALPSCAIIGGGGEDAMIQWTAPRTGNYTFDTDGSGFDTVLAVLDGCGGPELACNDDGVGLGLDSEITLDLVAGQSVILVVDSYDGDVGPFTLNISAL